MVAALVTLQRQNPHFLRQLPQLRPLLEPRKMLPLILLSAIAASGSLNSVVGARTIRQGGVVTGSGRAPPPPQEHSGELFCKTNWSFTHFGIQCILNQNAPKEGVGHENQPHRNPVKGILA